MSGLGAGFEPTIAVNPADPSNVIAGQFNQLVISTDYGETFPNTVNAQLPAGNFYSGFGGDPSLAFDSQGRLFWTFLVTRMDDPATMGADESGRSIAVQQVNPLTGALIGPAVDIDTTFDQHNYDKQWIAADANPASPFADNIYLVWTQLDGGVRVLFSRSLDQGTTWSTPADISGPNGGNGFVWPSHVAVATNGDVYAAWHNDNCGATDSTITVVRDGTGGLDMANGTAVQSSSFEAAVTCNVQGDGEEVPNFISWMMGSNAPYILPDPVRPGNVYVVANDDPNDDFGDGDDGDVVLARSTDYGNSWDLSTISHGPANSLQIMPIGAIDQEGNIAVSWYDARSLETNAGGNLLLDFYASSSRDGGLSFSNDFKINDDPFNPDLNAGCRFGPMPPCQEDDHDDMTLRIGEYNGIAASQGTVYLDWTGNFTNDMQEIFFDEFSMLGPFVDAYEPNNSLPSATILGSLPKVTIQDATLEDISDVDFYKYTAPNTGKLIANLFFNDGVADLELRVRDSNNNIIAFGAMSEILPGLDVEALVIPVVAQEEYFLEVLSVSAEANPVVYDLEIENFPAPVPSGVHLDPASDTGMMSNDNYTADPTPRLIIQADLTDFADMGINILSPSEVAGNEDGAAVEVFITNATTGVTTSGFASQVGGVSNLLFEFTPGFLGDGVYFVSAAVRIFDGQRDAGGLSDPATGRTQLSSPLWMTIDTVAPDPSLPDLLTSSDTGMYNDDDVTGKMRPAFQGEGEPGAKVRVLADGVVVGQGIVNTNGTWEVTVEPLDDGEYEITTELEDLAGNISFPDGEEGPESLTIWVDTTEPNTPYLDLLTDTGHSSTDNITTDNTPEFLLVGDDTVDGDGNPFPHDVKYRVYWRPGDSAGEVLVYDSFAELGDFTDLGSLTRTLTQDLNNPAGTPFPDGTHNFKLEVEDRAGNISHDFLLSIEIDTEILVVPELPPDLLASSDSGMFDDDNVTNINAPAFTGVAEAGAIVRVYATNVVTGEVQLVGQGLVGSDLSDVSIGGVGGFGGEPDDGLGLWEVTVEPLVDGVYDIQVEFEDWAGNVSELSEPLRIEIDTLGPNTAFLDLLESSDSGRHNDDNVTFDNTPTVSMTTEDPNASLHQILFTDNLKFRIFDRFENGEEFLLYNSVLDVAVDNILTAADGFTSLQQILETLPDQFFALFGSNNAVTAAGTLADGFHDLKLEVEDRAGNISHDFLFDLLIDTEAPPVTIIGIDPAVTDTGVTGFPDTFLDRVTSATAPAFIGRAEANAIVRLYVDSINNNAIDNPADFALTVAVPLDGDDAFPDGEWRTSFIHDLNDPDFFPFDRLREIIVTAEDLAGNVSPIVEDGENGNVQVLDIFLDTQGPQVTDVFLTDFPAFDLFDPKPSDGPTPPVFSITIDVRDLPARSDDDPNFLYEALLEAVAEKPGHYVLRGDANGVIPILDVEVINDPRFDNQIATASIILSFAEALPDDRYTLTLSDAIVDPVGNRLDGETNTIEPQEIPIFPSGDGQPGGAFVARFTIDSRPEIGTYAHSDVYLDINGNFTFDPTNVDFVNRDLASQFGALNDDLFNGNFAPAGAMSANGFDKLGAYGQVGGVFRFLIDFNGNMAVDPGETIVSNRQVNAIAVSGDFAPAHPGDEIGLFDGVTWYLDTTGDFVLNTTVSGNLRGFPIVGDFDGDGNDDLATYQADLFRFDLNFDGNTDDTIAFGFPGVLDRPVAKDYNLDGIDDIGLFVPNRDGVTPGEEAEWFFLLSERVEQEGGGFGTVDALDHPFSPVPLGNDIFAQFGDDLAIPLFGNFDPPLALTLGDDAVDGTGVYDPVAGVFHLKNENSDGTADNSFRYGPKNAGWLPVSGDWDGDSDATVGLFDPASSTFYLTNENAAGMADVVVRFGPSGSGWTPVVGDWDGDGDVTIGLFNPVTGTFYLKNDNTPGAADTVVRFGPAGSGWTPVVGDWDGDGDDTIGLFDAAAGKFYLKNSNTPGVADLAFRYGPAGAGWLPTLGDWDGDGDDSVGLYNPATGRFYLRNELTAGTADVQFGYASAGMLPLAGDWNGTAPTSDSTDFGLLAGIASYAESSSSTSDTASSDDSPTSAPTAAPATAPSRTSDSASSDSGSDGNTSDGSSDDGTDEVLDLALVELSGELLGGVDPSL